MKTILLTLLLLLSASAFSEAYYRVCGVLEYQKVDVSPIGVGFQYTINVENELFVLRFLSDNDRSIFTKYIMNRYEDSVINVCVEGDFGGRYTGTMEAEVTSIKHSQPEDATIYFERLD